MKSTFCKFCLLSRRDGTRTFRRTITLCRTLDGVGTGKQAQISVSLEPSAEQYLVENSLKPRYHQGVYHLKKRELPAKFVASAERILAYENISTLASDSKDLKNYLWSRKIPIEVSEYRQKVEQVENNLEQKDDVLRPFLSQEQLVKLDASRDNKIRNVLKKQIYHWEQMDYDKNTALQYLLARSAGEYAALLQIFSEICKRHEEFRPHTLCDFGSGIGTVVWAAKSTWPKDVHEVMCVDSSRNMNELAERLLRGGSMNNDHGFAALYFRQFLAQSPKISYDLAVSAYSLMELPSMNDRLKMIDILWKKTNKYLVIVEQGTPAGFKAVIEARDYVLKLDEEEHRLGRRPSGRDYRREEAAHVFSPCPHDLPCPRFAQGNYACRFYVKARRLYPFHQDNTETEVFSYVVLRKGERDPNDERWPRLISDPLIRKRHCICRVCAKDGNLREIILSKGTSSQLLYRVGRKSSCGDLLPVAEIHKDNTVSESTKCQEEEGHEYSDFDSNP